MYRASILNVGNELLRGSTVNTNAAFLGRELNLLGFMVRKSIACEDSVESISDGLQDLLGSSDLIIVTGGLGPTPDDVTRDALADYFNVPLVLSNAQYSLLKKLYKRYDKKVNPLIKREAMYPQNAKPLVNHFGVALGFSIQAGQSLIVVLPGVPSELEKMFLHDVKPLLSKKFKAAKTRPRLVVRMIGISEPDVMKRLKRDFFDEEFEFGIYPSCGEIQMSLHCRSHAQLLRLKKKVKIRLGKWIYEWGEKPLEEVIISKLSKKKMTLACAESCTGGLLSAELINVSGASSVFLGGVTAYSENAKLDLGVSQSVVKKHGQVSAEVARELALNVKLKYGCDIGVGVTGVAGPDGGTKSKPVGLVYLAVTTPRKTIVSENHFWGDRSQVRKRSVKKALQLILEQF